MPKTKSTAIHLPSDLITAAAAKASNQGQTIEAYLTSLVEADIGRPTAADVAMLIAAAPAIGPMLMDTNEC
ncbi:hypothetical protein VB780_08030 [Leptolyngbya sp. CCNP1308]|uniref:hypothetical protein n=1 Tax=Leptolyngbya sp. CCNP1308 TaxID=3110255 RepID=UPI002B1FFA67|nr:hypothetical protein [Leptolyngbya sp. CCNP1308]MEA5448510.1 hypothetical protein [Leptolyngbya sp. CCNP1308]